MALENEDFSKWKCQYQQEPIDIPDCNDCVWLNMTEDAQTESGNLLPHICRYYDRRVLHRTTSIVHSAYLHPCNECMNDKFEHYRKENDDDWKRLSKISNENLQYSLRQKERYA